MVLSKGQINKGSFKKGLIPWNKNLKGVMPKPWNKGIPRSDEEKRKISKSHIGKHLSEETKKKMGKAHTGMKHSEEIRNKIRESKLGEKNPMFGKQSWNKGMNKEEFKSHYKNGFGGAVNLEHKGEKNPNWFGGISFEPYDKSFNNRFKELIKIRDGFMCLKCGMKDEDHIRLFGIKEPIHHINYNKKFSIPENCCVLCVRCNTEVNTNRLHWTKFFQSLLSERYSYSYTELNEIILNVGSIK